MIQELSRIVRNETFDEQPLTKLSSEEIDFRAAAEQFDNIKQLTLKDVVHADYSQLGTPIRIAIFDDRIDIDNPSLLRFGLTIS